MTENNPSQSDGVRNRAADDLAVHRREPMRRQSELSVPWGGFPRFQQREMGDCMEIRLAGPLRVGWYLSFPKQIWRLLGTLRRSRYAKAMVSSIPTD